MPNNGSVPHKKDWIGTDGKEGRLSPDDELPTPGITDARRLLETGFDRGHMCPSGDRTKTFETTTRSSSCPTSSPSRPIRPQDLGATRNLLPRIGQSGPRTGDHSRTRRGGGRQQGLQDHPQRKWPDRRPIRDLEGDPGHPQGADDASRVENNFRTIAVIVPNHQGIDLDWRQYRQWSEKSGTTGYNFFSNVPQDVQDAIEVGVDGSAEDEGNQ